jgi:hypothetical protein
MLMKHLKPEIHLNNILKFTTFLTDIELRLYYKHKLIISV